MAASRPDDRRRALLRQRWVLLSDFALLVPSIPTRTLQYWAKTRRLPVSRRMGHRYWVDMQELKAMRRNGSETVFAEAADSALEGDPHDGLPPPATPAEVAADQLAELLGTPAETLRRWAHGRYHPHGPDGYVWLAEGAADADLAMGFALDPVKHCAAAGLSLLAAIPGTVVACRQLRQTLGLRGSHGAVPRGPIVDAILDMVSKVGTEPERKRGWQPQRPRIVRLGDRNP